MGDRRGYHEGAPLIAFGAFGSDNMRQDGAFDEAVKDVDAIEHMASPLTSTTGDPDGMWSYVAGDSPWSDRRKDYINPAVNGTIGILKSAYKFGYASTISHTPNSIC